MEAPVAMIAPVAESHRDIYLLYNLKKSYLIYLDSVKAYKY